MEYPLKSAEESEIQYLGATMKMTSVRFQGKPFNIRVIQVYVPTTSAEEAEVDQLYDDLEDLTITENLPK